MGATCTRHTRDFEDVVRLARENVATTSVAALMRTSWATVARIVARVVVDHLNHSRLEGLRRIGVEAKCRGAKVAAT